MSAFFAVDPSSASSYYRGAGATACDWSHWRLVLAEFLAHHAADLAQRRAIAECVLERVEEVALAAADAAQLLQAPADQRLVAVLLEALQASDLLVLGLRIDLENVHLDL